MRIGRQPAADGQVKPHWSLRLALLTLRAAAAGFDRHDAALSLRATLIRWDSAPLFLPEQAEAQDRFRCITLSSPYGHMAPLAEPDGWTPFLQGP